MQLKIFVNLHYQTLFFRLDLNFKEKPLVKPHHYSRGMLTKLVTFVIILVTTYFFLLAMVTKMVAAWSTDILQIEVKLYILQISHHLK